MIAKNFSIKKKKNGDWKWKNYGNKLEINKYGYKLENGNKLKMELKVYYIYNKILRQLLSLF